MSRALAHGILIVAVRAAGAETASCPPGALPVPAGTAVVAGAEVAVGAFCLDETEVTVGRYRECVAGGACSEPHATVAGPDLPARHVPLWSRSCNRQREGREDHPVNCVDWHQAAAFCDAVDGRLPSEGEWQLAAAGGDERRRYPWGRRRPTAERLNGCDFLCLDRLRALGLTHATLHYGEDGFADTAPVGSFPAGAGRWRHLDLAGNVWEFTSSLYGADPRVRVIRGGGWAQSDRQRVTSSYRGGFVDRARGSAVGFRCAYGLAE